MFYIAGNMSKKLVNIDVEVNELKGRVFLLGKLSFLIRSQSA